MFPSSRQKVEQSPPAPHISYCRPSSGDLLPVDICYLKVGKQIREKLPCNRGNPSSLWSFESVANVLWHLLNQTPGLRLYCSIVFVPPPVLCKVCSILRVTLAEDQNIFAPSCSRFTNSTFALFLHLTYRFGKGRDVCKERWDVIITVCLLYNWNVLIGVFFKCRLKAKLLLVSL